VLGRSSVALIGPRAGGALRHVAAVTACALAAHTVAYGSLVPQGGEHRYFGWYAPLVATLSAAAFLGMALALSIALLLGPTSGAVAVVRSILPSRSAGDPAIAGVLRLASAALAFLAVQESLERTLTAGRVELVSFTPATLALLVAIVVGAAAIVVLVQRIVSSLADVVLRVTRARPRASASPPARRRPTQVARRPRSLLALNAGLRAPPLLS
jgi:hypothetical protein